MPTSTASKKKWIVKVTGSTNPAEVVHEFDTRDQARAYARQNRANGMTAVVVGDHGGHKAPITKAIPKAVVSKSAAKRVALVTAPAAPQAVVGSPVAAPPTPVVTSVKRVTRIALVLDRSSSMNSIREEALQAFNSMLSAIRERAEAEKQETTISLFTFADTVKQVIITKDSAKVPNLSVYDPYGNTALFDAVQSAAADLKSQKREQDTEYGYLVIVVTDGQENRSVYTNAAKIKTLIETEQNTGEWTFAFSVPKGQAHTLKRFGIPDENIQEWETTGQGAQDMGMRTSQGIGTYLSARASGQKAVRNFFPKVTTDLSNVKASAVKRALDDVTDDYKLYNVPTEQVILKFVEEKTKKPFVLGSTFYQLMKPEKVQPQKQVLLMDIKTGKVFGGQGARDLIGLPDGLEAKVTPGAHGSHHIFVQSTSTNRILPRGTKILVRKA